ncbi:MAG: hypothetical protein ACRDN9_04370 [Streptosporangiaceae bacterium]
MNEFDEELRETLRARARHVGPPVDPVPGVRTQARRIHRRRTAVTATATGIGVVAVAVAVPVVVRHLTADQNDAPVVARPAVTSVTPPSAAAAAPQSGTPTASRSLPLSPASLPANAPDNVLRWGRNGTAPPRAFTHAAVHWFATHAGKHGSRPHVRVLWSGAIPGGRWAQLAQVWSPSRQRYADAWSTVLLVGRPNGTGVDDPYDAPTRFVHQRQGQSVAGTLDDVRRIAGYAFGFDGYILVVGEPKVEKARLSVDGQHVADEAPLTGGATVLRYGGAPTKTMLVQLRDAHGRVLTPSDALAAKTGASFEGWHPDTPPR